MMTFICWLRESVVGPFENCRNFYFLVAIGGEAGIRLSWRDFAL